MTLEIFNNKFYKDLDDTVAVGDMAENDNIVCYELPCHAQQSRTWKPSSDPNHDPLVLSVYMTKMQPNSYQYSGRSNFAYPFVVVLDSEQRKDRQKIYEAVVGRLNRWTKHSRDLWQWETDVMEEVRLTNSGNGTSITEIKENGDIVIQENETEESDIADAKSLIDEDAEGEVDTDEVLRRVGPKPALFELFVQSGHERYGTGAAWSSSGRWENWDTREEQVQHGEETSLVREKDALYCSWDENLRAYYFGDEQKAEHALWSADHFVEFRHPEYLEAKAANDAKQKKSISLHDCLQEFTREEQLGEDDLWYCPRCKKHQQATKKFDIWTVPDILVVHLKRFSNSRLLRDKIDAFVDFPIEGLDLDSFSGEREVAKRLIAQGEDLEEFGISDLDEPLVYDLYGVDEHMGGLGGGHYRAYAKNENDKWYHFDDSFVSAADATNAVVSSFVVCMHVFLTASPEPKCVLTILQAAY